MRKASTAPDTHTYPPNRARRPFSVSVFCCRWQWRRERQWLNDKHRPKLQIPENNWQLFSLQVAMETRETAANTLGALQDQGQQLDRINTDISVVSVCAML